MTAFAGSELLGPRPEKSPLVALTATLTMTRVAVPPVEPKEGDGAMCGETSDGTSGLGDREDRQRPPMDGASEGRAGCGWKLVYESELNEVFLDLVERDSDTVVMRIPARRLLEVPSQRSAEAARRSGGGEAQLNLLT